MKENYADSQLIHIIRIIVVYHTGIWTEDFGEEA